jgi:CRISPR-associated protein Csm3
MQLLYNVFIDFHIEALSGLAIGGSDTGIQIGGVDKVVIRNRLNDTPYIPGSSLRGKMRSMLEKSLGLPLNQDIGSNVRIHSAKSAAEYASSPVCQIFGVTGEYEWSRPSRLIVRDVPLSAQSMLKLNQQRLDLPYTEIKTEVAIDRITSAALPRTLERVPAGAVFGPGRMVFNVFSGDELVNDWMLLILQGMLLVEDSYLGGQGSRGSGQVSFRGVSLSYRQTQAPERLLDYGPAVTLFENQDLISIVAALYNKQVQLPATSGG